MAPGGIDFNLMGMLGSYSSDPVSSAAQKHESNIQMSNNSDLVSRISEFVEVAKKAQNYSQREGLETSQLDIARQIIDKAESNTAKILRDARTSLRPDEPEWSRESWVNKTTQKAMNVGDIDELSRVTRGATDSLRDFEVRTKKTDMVDFFRTALAGGGGAAFYQGLTAGNPVTVAGGILAGVGSVRDAYSASKERVAQAKAEGKEIDESPLTQAAEKAGVWFLGAAASALSDAYSSSIQRSFSALDFSEGLTRAQNQGLTFTRGDILGQTNSAGAFIQGTGMGNINGTRVLSIEQMNAATQIFSQTGGGSNKDFASMMDTFAKNTILYGEAAVTMLQASRNLDMWVPKGDFTGSMNDLADNLIKSGMPPELMQQALQATSQKIMEISKFSVNPTETANALIKQTEFLSTKLNFAGAQSAQIATESQGFASKALGSSSMVAYLTSKGVSVEEIARMQATGEQTPEIQKALSGMYGLVSPIQGEYTRKAIIGRVTGGQNLTEEAYRLHYGDNAHEYTHKTRPDASKNLREYSDLAQIRGKEYGLNVSELLYGFSKANDVMAGTAQEFKNAGQIFSRSVASFNSVVTATNGQFGGKGQKEPALAPPQHSSGQSKHWWPW